MVVLDEISPWIKYVVLPLAKCLCGIFCPSVYEDVKATVGALLDPQSFYGDAENLQKLIDKISLISRSVETDTWIEETKKTISQVLQLPRPEGGSSNHNDDRQSSCCLCLSCDRDPCSQCNLHKKIIKQIDQGDKIVKLSVLVQEPVKHIDNVPNIEGGTTAERTSKQILDVLNDDNGEARQLFSENAGEVVHVETIRKIAENLLLAFVLKGSAMKGKRDIGERRNAVVDPILYNPLKLRYDSPDNTLLKDCLLYCSLYPIQINVTCNF